MTDKFTPGKWIALPDPNSFHDDWVVGTEEQIDSVAVCSERDAHLIAAAPELLDALLDLQAIRSECFIPNPGGWLDNKINAAIAKARGE